MRGAFLLVRDSLFTCLRFDVARACVVFEGWLLLAELLQLLQDVCVQSQLDLCHA